MNGQPPSVSSVNTPLPKPRKMFGSGIARLVFYGVVFLIFSFMLSMIWPNAQEKERARAAQCLCNVHLIGLACAEYAEAYDGRLPQKLDSLTNRLSSTPMRIFICPLAKDSNSYSYAFTGVTNKWNDGSNVIVLREIEAHHDGTRTLLFNDGHVKQRKD